MKNQDRIGFICFSLFYSRNKFHDLFKEIRIEFENHNSLLNHFAILVSPYYYDGRVDVIMGTLKDQLPYLKDEFQSHLNLFLTTNSTKRIEKLPYGKRIWIDDRTNTIAYNSFNISPVFKKKDFFLFQKLLSQLIFELVEEDYEDGFLSLVAFVYITISKKQVLPLHNLMKYTAFVDDGNINLIDNIEIFNQYSDPEWEDRKLKSIYEAFVKEIAHLYGMHSYERTFLLLIEIINKMLSVPPNLSSFLWNSVCLFRNLNESDSQY